MPSPSRELVIDTSGFFAKSSRIVSLKQSGFAELCTLDLIVFEFVKVLEVEVRRARSGKKLKRLETLNAIRARFPDLLRNLGIKIRSPEFENDDMLQLFSLVALGLDAGDCMIWLKMRKAGLESIATSDASDWKQLGAKIILL